MQEHTKEKPLLAERLFFSSLAMKRKIYRILVVVRAVTIVTVAIACAIAAVAATSVERAGLVESANVEVVE